MEDVLSKYIVKINSAVDTNNNISNSLIDACNNPLIQTRCIKEYYDNTNIFVTGEYDFENFALRFIFNLIIGSTGFLGKVLIEKLLRSCNGIKKIFILLRAKRGLSSEHRFKDFLKNQVFDRIIKKSPELLEKLVCISGDIMDPNIGLDEQGMKMITEQVDIVFHVAATVRFNEALQDAANLNTFGTERVMKLCTKIRNLKVSVF